MIDRENAAAQAAMTSSGNQGRYDGSLQVSHLAYQGLPQQQQGRFADAQLSSPVYGACGVDRLPVLEVERNEPRGGVTTINAPHLLIRCLELPGARLRVDRPNALGDFDTVSFSDRDVQIIIRALKSMPHDTLFLCELLGAY